MTIEHLLAQGPGIDETDDATELNRAFLERAAAEGLVDVGYAVTRKLYLRGAWLWQHTHGGVRAGSLTGDPFFLPGELDDGPGWILESDRILKVRYMQVVGGLSYGAGPVDFYGTFTKYVWGRDAHNGYAFGAGATWYFGLP